MKRIWMPTIVVILLFLTLGCQLGSAVTQFAANPTVISSRTPAPTFTVVPSSTSTVLPTVASTLLSTVTKTVTRKPVATSTKKPNTPVPTVVPGAQRLPVKVPLLMPKMSIKQAAPVHGKLYCQITFFEFVKNNPANPDSSTWAQNKLGAYFYIRDGQDSDINADRTIKATWSSGETLINNSAMGGQFDTWLEDRSNTLGYTRLNGQGWIPNPGHYNGDLVMGDPITRHGNPEGSYNAVVSGDDVVSDAAIGLGVADDGSPAANIVQWVCQLY